MPYAGLEDRVLAVTSGKPSVSRCAYRTPGFCAKFIFMFILNFLDPNLCDPLGELCWDCLSFGARFRKRATCQTGWEVSRVRVSRACGKPALSSPCRGSRDSVVLCPGINRRKDGARVKHDGDC